MSNELTQASNNLETLRDPLIPASVGIRLVAAMVDLMAVTILFAIVSAVPLILSQPAVTDHGIYFLVAKWLVVVLALFVIVPIAYHTVLVARYSATLGKTFCSIKVVHLNGRRIGYLAAATRYLCSWGSLCLFFAGYVIALFDTDRRTLHDRVAGTLVVLARQE